MDLREREGRSGDGVWDEWREERLQSGCIVGEENTK